MGHAVFDPLFPPEHYVPSCPPAPPSEEAYRVWKEVISGHFSCYRMFPGADHRSALEAAIKSGWVCKRGLVLVQFRGGGSIVPFEVGERPSLFIEEG